MKKMIERIRGAKTWQERYDIARNKWPGTRFDSFFESAERAIQFAKDKHFGNAQHEAAILGATIAKIIHKRDSQALQDMTNALIKLKHHELTAKPDYVLMALVASVGMFPPGWSKNWRASPIPKGYNDRIRVRDVIANLRRTDPNFDKEKLEAYRKRIQRYAESLQYGLDRSAFKPKGKVRHFGKKKSVSCHFSK